jgi:hypothetical protein
MPAGKLGAHVRDRVFADRGIRMAMKYRSAHPLSERMLQVRRLRQSDGR